MSEKTLREAAYDQIDRFLRNNLSDEDYADYSQALDLIYTTAPEGTDGVKPCGESGWCMKPECRKCHPVASNAPGVQGGSDGH
jgi:hypothetical protein